MRVTEEMRPAATGAESGSTNRMFSGSWSRACGLWLQVCLALAGLLFAGGSLFGAQNITINGAQTYQILDGLGANIHYYAWTNDDLVPVLDALIDQGGLKVFRVVFDNTDWEATNVYVSTNTNTIDWDYFNSIYSSARFQHLWGLIGYLNQKGISNGVMLNFQGLGPAWMGQPLTPGYEDNWAQMIASLLVYARNTEHLQFSLVGPDNEMNGSPNVQGVATEGPGQYVTMLHDLANQLDDNGIGDFQIVGPDLSGSSTNWMPDMVGDPTVMGKLAHFSMHSYLGDGDGSSA